MMIHQDARLSRQSQIVAPRLLHASALVCGVGMLGSFTAMALARCVAEVVVFDPDVVEDVNSGNQAYHGDNVGRSKVEAMESLNVGLPLTGRLGEFPLDKAPRDLLQYQDNDLIVVSAADSMTVRAAMANYAKVHKASLFVDSRAQGELAVICIVPPSHIEAYLADLPGDDEVPNIACGATGTAYTGMWVAGRVMTYLNAHFRGMPNVPWIHVEDLGGGNVLRHELP